LNYILSQKYDTPELQKKIMGPNPVKLAEELLQGNQLPERAVVCVSKEKGMEVSTEKVGGLVGRERPTTEV